MLPGFDGLEVLRRMRGAGIATPVLLLTARDAVDDRVRGLDAGADDYLAKPFAVAELLARLRSLVRRGGRSGPVRLAVGDLVVDTVSRRVERAGRAVALTPKEYALLEMLARRAGSLVTRIEIRDRLYAFEADSDSNVVDVLIGRLRRKIQAGDEPPLLHTRRGHGVMLGEAGTP
jgi:DNA-binding response OmpR family regulator